MKTYDELVEQLTEVADELLERYNIDLADIVDIVKDQCSEAENYCDNPYCLVQNCTGSCR